MGLGELGRDCMDIRALYIVVNHNTTVCIRGIVHRAVLNHGHEWSVHWPGGLSNFETVNGGTEPVLVWTLRGRMEGEVAKEGE